MIVEQDVTALAGAVDALADALEIPDYAYERASARYRDLGEWLQDTTRASCARYGPAVSPQGSFRLGTATRPWNREHYDLDLTCLLRTGVDRGSWTQEAVKVLVGADLENYRHARNIRERIEEKHRCWRLNYQDELTFHMDAVPAIPQNNQIRAHLRDLMIRSGSAEDRANYVSRLAVAITDNRLPQYRTITDDWLKSNPEGYARWFEDRMRQVVSSLRWRADGTWVESLDDLPTYLWKTPLQRSIQVLKRHRDVMFERNPDVKPTSIIITTLAATAYAGEPDLLRALQNILDSIEEQVAPVLPRVPNPVNPEEDFADRWSTREGRSLELERQFWWWLQQVRTDLDLFLGATSEEAMAAQAVEKFGATVDRQILATALRSDRTRQQTNVVHHIRPQSVPKPWRR